MKMVFIRTRDPISGIETPAHKQIHPTTLGGGGVASRRGGGASQVQKISRILTVNRILNHAVY
jgi:hypothetical protein